MDYPESLTPVGAARYTLPSGTVVSIPTAHPTFPRWEHHPPQAHDRRCRSLLAVNRRGCTAEQAILAVLERDGWCGVWVRAFGTCLCTSAGTRTSIPRERAAVLDGIYARNSNRHGCFDLFAWKRRDLLFAEAKHRGTDRMNALRLRWLDAALRWGIPPDAFLIVEWDFRS